MELGLFSPSPMSEPKEPPMRTAFNIIAAVIAVFAFGLEMEGSHPYWGMFFMAAALGYGAWELFTSKAAISRFSAPIRVMFLIALSGVFGWVSWPHILDITSPKRAQPVERVPSASEIADELAKRAPKPPDAPYPKKSSPVFSVVVEDKVFSPGGNTPTSFRIFQGNRLGGCNLVPVDLLLFLRITNLQDTDAMISAYSVEIGGWEYQRISMVVAGLYWLPDRGGIPKVGQIINWVPGGEGHISVQETKDADASHAASVNSQILDWELGGKYLGPKKVARGWAFFDYPKGQTLSISDVQIKITDQTGKTFSYKVPHRKLGGNMNGDVLPRLTTVGPIVDLSRCVLGPLTE
jgi:hypothetical protein